MAVSREEEKGSSVISYVLELLGESVLLFWWEMTVFTSCPGNITFSLGEWV